MSQTVTVGELVKVLSKVPADYKVYLSSDPEGNNYGSLQADYMLGGSDIDKTIILYPIEMNSDYDDICPKESEKMDEEIEAEIAAKKKEG